MAPVAKTAQALGWCGFNKLAELEGDMRNQATRSHGYFPEGFGTKSSERRCGPLHKVLRVGGDKPRYPPALFLLANLPCLREQLEPQPDPDGDNRAFCLHPEDERNSAFAPVVKEYNEGHTDHKVQGFLGDMWTAACVANGKPFTEASLMRCTAADMLLRKQSLKQTAQFKKMLPKKPRSHDLHRYSRTSMLAWMTPMARKAHIADEWRKPGADSDAPDLIPAADRARFGVVQKEIAKNFLTAKNLLDFDEDTANTLVGEAVLIDGREATVTARNVQRDSAYTVGAKKVSALQLYEMLVRGEAKALVAKVRPIPSCPV